MFHRAHAGLFIVLFLGILTALASPTARAQCWSTLNSGVDTNLRGISAAKIPSSEHMAIWASGSHGVILRSLDDGATWSRLSGRDQPELDVRRLLAFACETARPMSR